MTIEEIRKEISKWNNNIRAEQAFKIGAGIIIRLVLETRFMAAEVSKYLI